MGWNVPDDWGSYYTKCSRCGSRYHQSEGGCGCMDSLESCQCGKCNWEDTHAGPRCCDCDTGPREEGRKHRRVHVARKSHEPGIRPGDKYQRIVCFAHYPGGAFTLSVRKHRLEKGPNWVAAEVMES
jgi:hypothetical protein